MYEKHFVLVELTQLLFPFNSNFMQTFDFMQITKSLVCGSEVENLKKETLRDQYMIVSPKSLFCLSLILYTNKLIVHVFY